MRGKILIGSHVLAGIGDVCKWGHIEYRSHIKWCYVDNIVMYSPKQE